MEAEELLSGIQDQIDASASAVAGQVSAVQFFPAAYPGTFQATVSEVPSEETLCDHDSELSNSDTADAAGRGAFTSEFEHQIASVKREGGTFQPIEFVDLELNSDVAHGVQPGKFVSGHDHWQRCGRLEGRSALEAMPRTLSNLKELGSEMHVTLEQIGDVPANPGTVRGAIGHWIILILRRLLWWHTRSVSAFADVVTRDLKEHVAFLEHLSKTQEENQRTLLSIQQALTGMGARLEESARQERQLASRTSQLESDLRITAELNVSLAAELERARGLEGWGAPECRHENP
jgi:hypothetical protein